MFTAVLNAYNWKFNNRLADGQKCSYNEKIIT